SFRCETNAQEIGLFAGEKVRGRNCFGDEPLLDHIVYEQFYIAKIICQSNGPEVSSQRTFFFFLEVLRPGVHRPIGIEIIRTTNLMCLTESSNKLIRRPGIFSNRFLLQHHDMHHREESVFVKIARLFGARVWKDPAKFCVCPGSWYRRSWRYNRIERFVF